MSHRDYEPQPESPDLGEAVQEDTGDTLVGPPDSDPLDAGYVPPDRPYLIEDDEAVSPEESLDRRLGRERPEVGPDDPEGGGGDPDRAPRLEADSEAGDGYSDSGLAHSVGIDGGAASGEEAAVHYTDSPTELTDPEGDADLGAEVLADPAADRAVDEAVGGDPAGGPAGDPGAAEADAKWDAGVDPRTDDRMAADIDRERREVHG